MGVGKVVLKAPQPPKGESQPTRPSTTKKQPATSAPNELPLAGSGGFSYAEKKEQDKLQRKLQKQRDDLEKQIENCDVELAKMDTELAENPANTASAEFFEKYNAVKKQQEILMWKWGELI